MNVQRRWFQIHSIGRPLIRSPAPADTMDSGDDAALAVFGAWVSRSAISRMMDWSSPSEPATPSSTGDITNRHDRRGLPMGRGSADAGLRAILHPRLASSEASSMGQSVRGVAQSANSGRSDRPSAGCFLATGALFGSRRRAILALSVRRRDFTQNRMRDNTLPNSRAGPWTLFSNSIAPSDLSA